jgi:membrane-bound inhibitor of C-type lysozyme
VTEPVRERRRAIVAAALLIAAGQAGAAAAGPETACAPGGPDARGVLCSDAALAALGAEAERLLRLAEAGLPPDEGAALRAASGRWAEEDEACGAAPAGAGGCLASLRLGRIHALRRDHAAARSGEGASLGPFAYRCDGLMEPLSVVFVNLDPGLAWAEWSGFTLALVQAPSGSGARYAADAPAGPAELWIKGDEARFTPPGGEALACGEAPGRL